MEMPSHIILNFLRNQSGGIFFRARWVRVKRILKLVLSYCVGSRNLDAIVWVKKLLLLARADINFRGILSCQCWSLCLPLPRSRTLPPSLSPSLPLPLPLPLPLLLLLSLSPCVSLSVSVRLSLSLSLSLSITYIFTTSELTRRTNNVNEVKLIYFEVVLCSARTHFWAESNNCSWSAKLPTQ